MPGETLCGLRRNHARRGLSRRPTKADRSRQAPIVARNTTDFLQCVKIAVLAAAIMVAFCVEANAQEVLSEREIRTQIIGHSFRGKKGLMSVSLRYAEDGAVTIRAPVGGGAGTWTVSDDRLCMKIVTGPRKMDDCLTFTRQPGGIYRASNGMRLTPVE